MGGIGNPNRCLVTRGCSHCSRGAQAAWKRIDWRVGGDGKREWAWCCILDSEGCYGLRSHDPSRTAASALDSLWPASRDEYRKPRSSAVPQQHGSFHVGLLFSEGGNWPFPACGSA